MYHNDKIKLYSNYYIGAFYSPSYQNIIFTDYFNTIKNKLIILAILMLGIILGVVVLTTLVTMPYIIKVILSSHNDPLTVTETLQHDLNSPSEWYAT